MLNDVRDGHRVRDLDGHGRTRNAGAGEVLPDGCRNRAPCLKRESLQEPHAKAETRHTRLDAGRAHFHRPSRVGHATGGLDVAPTAEDYLDSYLVTGCAGFLAHLTEALLEQGNDVVGVDGFTDFYSHDAKYENLARARASNRFSLIEGHLTELDADHLLDRVSGVFHLAAQAWILVSEHAVASGSGATPGSSTHNAAETASVDIVHGVGAVGSVAGATLITSRRSGSVVVASLRSLALSFAFRRSSSSSSRRTMFSSQAQHSPGIASA
jgi:GDP-mannose 4,6 dehydratase